MSNHYTLDGIPSDLLTSSLVGSRRFKVEDATLAISRGEVAGAVPFSAFGKLETAGAVTEKLLWGDGDWTAPPSYGEQISVVSTSIEDSATGTGTRVLHIHYLDSNLMEHEESVTLNGTTPVLTTATDIRFIQCSHGTSFGSTKATVGDINFVGVTSTVVYNYLYAGQKRCTSSARMIPKNKYLFLSGAVASSISGTSLARTSVEIVGSYFYDFDYTEDSILVPFGSIGVQDSSIAFNFPVPIRFPEGSIVAMTCSTDKACLITGDWFGWLEDAETIGYQILEDVNGVVLSDLSNKILEVERA